MKKTLIITAVLALSFAAWLMAQAPLQKPADAPQPTVAELQAKLAEKDKTIAWLEATLKIKTAEFSALLGLYNATKESEKLGPRP